MEKKSEDQEFSSVSRTIKPVYKKGKILFEDVASTEYFLIDNITKLFDV